MDDCSCDCSGCDGCFDDGLSCDDCCGCDCSCDDGLFSCGYCCSDSSYLCFEGRSDRDKRKQDKHEEDLGKTEQSGIKATEVITTQPGLDGGQIISN
ncbi:hypothetical protein SK128_006013 [Halocaridina rubra]|uniref:SMB domain-containing protein n=1 Tax=Halocaridina rubra TaxID=373956 RepID=A0AAN8WMW3_HALRR